MAGFSIVTNVNSLLAQENLGRTNELQTRTIQRLTSGLRINSSADDAAGLAVANRFRSDIAVLKQGVRNGADGLSTLQTIDGGLNNISLLIDRARTLATQSASGTFTGDRGTLNSEFQSVIEEINRQAQAIGLDAGGTFNANLSVFIGGGRSNSGVTEVQNGAVTIDLTGSAVGGQQLGLQGVRALGGVEGTTDIGNSSTTSVQNIVQDATNLASVRTSGFTELVFSGPGFADGGKARLSVNLAGVVDANTLVAAINNAIAGFSATSASGQQFKDAGIKAVVNTDSTGKQQLAFTSSTTAFQVKSGDRLSNALLGNFSSGATGETLNVTATGAATAIAQSAANTITAVFYGGGLSSPQELSITTTLGDSQADVITALQAAIAADSTLSDAGFSVTQVGGNQTQFTNALGESFQVRVVGDIDNTLGFGTAELDGGGEARYNTIASTYAAPAAGATASISILLEGETTAQTLSITVATGATAQNFVDQVNAAINNNAVLSGAGLRATTAGGVTFETTTAGGGGNFLIAVNDDNANQLLTSFTDGDAEAGVLAGTLADSGVEATVNSGGAQATTSSSANPIGFTGLTYGNGVQSLSTPRTPRTVHALNVSLSNANALTVDDAVSSINAALQASNNSTLQQVVAVKERSGAGTEGIRFLANLPNGFTVSVGDLANDHGLANASASDLLLTSGALAGGSVADIHQGERRQRRHAAAGRVDPRQHSGRRGPRPEPVQFAISLATTQITNISAAESRIREADLAQEAANLTRASIAQQAGVAALAQANSAPQAVLALLRG